MPKISSYIKALIPGQDITRSVNLPAHINNLLSISPRNQYEIAGQVIPRVGSNGWQNQARIDYQYLDKIYQCHDLVWSSINLVSRTFALAKLRVKQLDPKTKKYNYVPDHPFQKLLDNPNSSMGSFDLQQAYIVHRLLYGTMGAILIRESMTSASYELNRCPMCREIDRETQDCTHILWHFNTGPVTQIMPVHLDRLDVEEVETPQGVKEYFVYEYRGIKTLVHPNNIMTDPMYNPGGSFFGTSPTMEVQRWLEIDLGLSTQIGAYLKNNAIPSMILNLKPPKVGEGGRMEDPSLLLNMMKERWMKDFSLDSYRNGNGKSIKAPAFTYGDLEILKIQDGIKDIVQKPLFYEIQDRITRAYNVPKTYFEFGAAHGLDSEKENKNFYNYAIAPELESFKYKIERFILPTFEDASTLSLSWDLSNMGISSFLEDKNRAHILKIWELGLISRDHARDLLGFDPIAGILGDDLYRIDVLGSTEDGRRLNQPKEDNILKPNPGLTRRANTEIT